MAVAAKMGVGEVATLATVLIVPPQAERQAAIANNQIRFISSILPYKQTNTLQTTPLK
jgi:hypothetical protein